MSSDSVPLSSSVSMRSVTKGIRYIEFLCIISGGRLLSSTLPGTFWKWVQTSAPLRLTAHSTDFEMASRRPSACEYPREHFLARLRFLDDPAMMRLLTVLTCGALTLRFLGADNARRQNKNAPAGERKHQVLMDDNKYKPDKITIEVGDSIVWVNKGKKTHTASSDEKLPKDLEFDTED